MSKPKYEIRPFGVMAGNIPMYDIISNGRRCITDFDRSLKSLYAEAVKIYNGKHNGRILTIRQDAPYSFDGKTVKDCNSMEPCNSLWAPDDRRDLSDFWRFVEGLETKTLERRHSMTGVFADALMDTIKAADLVAVAAVVYAAAMMALFKSNNKRNGRRKLK